MRGASLNFARAIQALFWIALIFAFVMATLPKPPHLPVNDKTQHMLAFLTLALLAATAYPRARLFGIAALLAGFGALIEFVQLIPGLNRSADPLDWLADVAALLVGLGIGALLRRWLRLS